MNILIVDDHAVICQTLEMIINDEFPKAHCVSASTGQACLKLIQDQAFDLIILDLNLPDIEGVKIASQIREAIPDQMIMIFSMNATDLFATELYRLGVMGYLNKDANMPEIRKALNSILRDKKTYADQSYCSGTSKNAVLANSTCLFDKLSQRELEVARLLATGKTMEDIATHLSVGSSTIRTYKARLFEKLDVKSIYDFLTKAKLRALEPLPAEF